MDYRLVSSEGLSGGDGEVGMPVLRKPLTADSTLCLEGLLVSYQSANNYMESLEDMDYILVRKRFATGLL